MAAGTLHVRHRSGTAHLRASLMRAALEAVMDGWMPLVTLIALAGTFAIMVAWLVYA
jgi:hypothetical protein